MTPPKKARPGGLASTHPLQHFVTRRRADETEEVLAGPFARREDLLRTLKQLRADGHEGLIESVVADFTNPR